VRVLRQARTLVSKLRFVRTLKYASGIDLDPLSVGARRRRSSAPTVGAAICAKALPRHSGVLNKSLGLDRPPVECAMARTWVDRMTPAKPVPVGSSPDERAGGPNAAQPVTQTVSNPYLRVETADGKLLPEKTQETWAADSN
jgi:hypothetical protein